jgi:hypothetical protein
MYFCGIPPFLRILFYMYQHISPFHTTDQNVIYSKFNDCVNNVYNRKPLIINKLTIISHHFHAPQTVKVFINTKIGANLHRFCNTPIVLNDL